MLNEDELAGIIWTVNPVLSEILLVGQVNYYKSHGMVRPCQSTVHQASSQLRRKRLFFIWSTNTSPQLPSVKPI